MKKRRLFCAVLALVLGLTGCSEHDTGYVEPKEKEDLSAVHVEVDLDKAYSGDRCMIYEGRAWNPPEEDKILKAFFKDCKKRDYTREEQGDQTQLDYERKDQKGTSLSTYGENAPHYSCGIAYGTKEAEKVNALLDNKETEEKVDAYYAYGGAPDTEWEKTGITEEKKKAEELASQVSMPYYEPEYVISFKQKKDHIKQIFWRQMIGGIPVCTIPINKNGGGTAGKIIYNDKLQVKGLEEQRNGILTTTYRNGELVNWFNYDAVTDMKPLKEMDLVPVAEAYETAASQAVQDLAGKTDDIRLVRAVLEYKVTGRNGKVYAYPVWDLNFDADLPQGSDSHYVYLVDACTGKFFTGIDAAFE